jgi:outer membrane protein assembly factor BamE (lipoprotein component of BamABCDE complex)
MLHRRAILIRAAIGLLAVVVCAPFLALGTELAVFTITTPAGVGDVQVANSKIKNGMSKKEVQSVLGAPHRDRGDEWDYWDSRYIVDSVLRIHFGDDDKVTSSEWWVV